MPSLSGAAAMLPTAPQEALLRAALLDRPAALEAWRVWRTRHAWGRLEALDAGSTRMLPLVHTHLGGEDGALGADRELLRRLHRGSWCRNQQLLAAARPVLADLQAAGIEPVLLKGASLGITVYPDSGARPMSDVDFLVRPAQALDAGRILQRHGLQPIAKLDRQRVRTQAGLNFGRPAADGVDAASMDLHWHLTHEPCGADFDDAVHARAPRATLLGLPVKVLQATDELWLACLHGMRWNPMPPFRWAADVHLLVTRGGGAIDWDRFTAATRRHGFALPVCMALGYCLRALGTPVPRPVMQALEAHRPTWFERADMALRHPPRLRGVFGGLPRHVLRWLRMSEGERLPSRLGGLPGYLADCWGCGHVAELPWRAARLAARRVHAAWTGHEAVR